jgi:hypothetical protein
MVRCSPDVSARNQSLNFTTSTQPRFLGKVHDSGKFDKWILYGLVSKKNEANDEQMMSK